MAFNLGNAVGYLDLDTTKFKAGFQSALQDLQTFQSQTATFNNKLYSVGSSMTKVGSNLTTSLTLPLVGAGTLAVKTASDFESAMSKVMAITDTSAEGYEVTYDKLSDKAKEMGATTRYSASEAADALYYMSLAGWSANEAISGIDGVLSLAAASGMDLAQASDMVTDYLTAFGLQSDYAANMADVLAYAQANSNTTTQLLGDAFGNCATNAHAFGASLEETTSYLSALANSGLKGSEAGTALSAVFRDMTQKMEDGAIQIGETSIAVQDSEGNFRSLTDILRDVESATEGMGTAQKSAALMNTFTARSIKAVNILLGEGSDSIEEFTGSLLSSFGTAESQSEAMLNNLSGQFTILKSSLEALLISFGDILLPVVKDVVGFIQDLVTKINNLSDAEKEQIAHILEIAAAVGPVLLIVGKLLTAFSKVSSLISGIGKAGSAFSSIASTLGAALGPVLAVAAAIGVVVAAFVTLWNTNEEFRNNITETWEEIKSTVEEFIEGISSRFEELGITWEGVVDTLSTIWAGFCDLMAPLFEGVFSEIQIIVETFLGVITELFDVIAGIFTGDSGRIKQGLNEIKDSILTGLSDTFENALDTLKGMAETALSWIGTSLSAVWEGIVSFFTESIPAAFDAVVTFFEELPAKIEYALGYLIGTVARFIVDLVSEAQRIGPEVVDKILTFFQELPNKIKAFLTAAVEAIKGWAQDVSNWVTAEIPKIVSQIVSFFEELPGKLLDIGKNMLQGLVDGITSGVGKVVSKVKEVASNIAQGFKDAFQEKSPSKLTRQYGVWLMEGLSNGITQRVSSVVDIVKNSSRMIGDAFNGALSIEGSDVSDILLSRYQNDPPYAYSRARSSSESQRSIQYNFVYNSPKEIDPIEASRLLKQTAKQLSLEV